jgi:predicted transcriptional regulator
MAKTTEALERAVLAQLSALGGHCHGVDELFSKCNCKVSQRSQICHSLQKAGLVTLREDIVRFGLTVTGKTLLRLDTSVWPVTPDQLLVLRSCMRGRISPHQIHPRVPVDQRQGLLHELAQQRLITVYQTAIVDIKLLRQPA